jgi:hypothetical protein
MRRHMQGGVVVFLFFIIIVVGAIATIFLTGAGGYARHRQVEGELGHDDEEFRRLNGDGGEPRRPEHVRVEDDSRSTFDVPPD